MKVSFPNMVITESFCIEFIYLTTLSHFVWTWKEVIVSFGRSSAFAATLLYTLGLLFLGLVGFF